MYKLGWYIVRYLCNTRAVQPVLSQGNRAKPCKFRYVKPVGNFMRKIAIEGENSRFWRPHSYLTPPQQRTRRISALPETTDGGAASLPLKYMRISVYFKTIIPSLNDSTWKTVHNAKLLFKVIQGHLFQCRWKAIVLRCRSFECDHSTDAMSNLSGIPRAHFQCIAAHSTSEMLHAVSMIPAAITTVLPLTRRQASDSSQLDVEEITHRLFLLITHSCRNWWRWSSFVAGATRLTDVMCRWDEIFTVDADALRCTVFVVVILSVCLSVRLSHSWTVSTWFDLRSWFLHHMVAPSF